MEIQIAVAKINQYGSSESGDTLEIVERPNGGISIVMADALSSGKNAKIVSTTIVRKVIGLIAAGVRDGAAARAASDALYTERNGESAACLNVLSVDLQTGTLVLSRNNPTPVFVSQGDRIECLSGESLPIGNARNIRPAISEISIVADTVIVMYTDGMVKAGKSSRESLDICTLLSSMLEEQEPHPQEIADTLLAEAIRMDHGQPNDDMSVVVLRVSAQEKDNIRRMTVRLPFETDTETSSWYQSSELPSA